MSIATPLPLYTSEVLPEWVDYNDHLNDGCYGIVFSHAVDHWFDLLGMGAEFRRDTGLTMYTLESHIRYLKEAALHTPLAVDGLLYDADAKRMHVLMTMRHARTGETLATAEQLLMCMNREGPIPAPFPAAVAQRLEQSLAAHREHADLRAVRRPMGIRRSNSI